MNRPITLLALLASIAASAQGQEPPTRVTGTGSAAEGQDTPLRAAAPAAQGLTLDEAFRLAAARSPRLAGAHALAEAAAHAEPSAGLPPDPYLEVGLMNLSVPGFRADMPTSMAPSIRAMQMVPFPGKLGLKRRIAERGTAIRETQANEVWWEVRARVAMAYYEIYAADREIEVMRETLGLLENFERIARAMYASGEGRQADVLRAGVESARMDAEIERMEAMRDVARARLNALLDRPADTPVPSVAYPALPGSTPSSDTLRSWADATGPLLEEGRLEVRRAGDRRDLVRRDLWPDLALGVEVGRRSTEDMGVERMASLMVGFSVPVFARSRQLRSRDEAEAMERMALAELDERVAAVDGRIAGLVAGLDRTRTLIRLFRGDVLPQARTNVESAFSSYRVGHVDFMTLVDAQMSVNRYEGELIRLLAEYGTGVAELEMTLGRELPLGMDSIVEER